MDFFIRQNAAFKIIFTIAFFSFWIFLLLVYSYIKYKSDVTEDTRTRVHEQTQLASTRYEMLFSSLVGDVVELSENIADGTVKKTEIEPSIHKLFEGTDYEQFGIGVAFLPYINATNVREVTPFYIRRDSTRTLEDINLVTVFRAPIIRRDTITGSEIKIGEVFIDFELEDIVNVLSDLDLGRSGFGYLLLKNGQFIAHPRTEYNLNPSVTIAKIAQELNDPALMELAQQAQSVDTVFQGGILEYENELTGQDSWIFHEPIMSVSWTLVVTYVKDDILIDVQYLQRQLIWISLVLLLFIITFSALITKAYTANTNSLVMVTVLVSLSLIGEIVYIWNLTMDFTEIDDVGFEKVVDITSANNYKARYNKRVERICGQSPTYIPTGIFLESIEFSSANNIFLSGTIWQRYPKDYFLRVRDSVKLGIMFPEAIQDFFSEIYTIDKYDHIVKGWNFRITIRKNFDYARYPFDKKKLTIRILPQDFKNYIILSPDLEAYRYTNPKLLPGISETLSVRGYQMLNSYFVYKNNSYNSDFSIDNFGCRENTPELYFNVSMKRQFMGTIFSGTIPIVVMLAILFVLQTITTESMDTVSRILGPTGSFFFASLLAHIGLRERLEIQDIVYFEYFYILLYTMILYVFLNSVLYSREKKSIVFKYKNNLIFKLIYWPFFLVTLLIISVVVLLL